jgi:hypothetical protein
MPDSKNRFIENQLFKGATRLVRQDDVFEMVNVLISTNDQMYILMLIKRWEMEDFETVKLVVRHSYK